MFKLSVIIINYNTPDMTERVIKNFYAQESDLSVEFILIDNSTEKFFSPEKAGKLGVKLIKNNYNAGFAAAVNQGLKEARGEYVLLLNPE